jgi:hypothetical protein
MWKVIIAAVERKKAVYKVKLCLMRTEVILTGVSEFEDMTVSRNDISCHGTQMIIFYIFDLKIQGAQGFVIWYLEPF